MKEKFLKMLDDLGEQTRLVECSIQAFYSPESNELLQEYDKIASFGDDLNSRVKRISSKNLDSINELILDLLLEINNKLNRIENLNQHFLELDSSSNICFLGHGIICLDSSDLVESRSYFVRFILPNSANRTIGVFATALNKEILKITKIPESFNEELDSFIVLKEMEFLRQRRKND